MLSLRTVSAVCRQNKYVFSRNMPRTLFCSKVAGAEKDVTEQINMNPEDQVMRLSTANRIYMMFARKHKKLADVPESMTVGEYRGLINRARIGMNVSLLIVMLFVAMAALYKGKSQFKAGDTLASRNREFEKRINAERAEAAAAKQQWIRDWGRHKWVNTGLLDWKSFQTSLTYWINFTFYFGVKYAECSGWKLQPAMPSLVQIYFRDGLF